MAQHQVRARVDTKVIGPKDLAITVERNGKKLGTLLISKGNIKWLPKGNSINKKRVGWKRFSDLMETKGRSEKVRK
jgi:hypothetical protein